MADIKSNSFLNGTTLTFTGIIIKSINGYGLNLMLISHMQQSLILINLEHIKVGYILLFGSGWNKFYTFMDMKEIIIFLWLRTNRRQKSGALSKDKVIRNRVGEYLVLCPLSPRLVLLECCHAASLPAGLPAEQAAFIL